MKGRPVLFFGVPLVFVVSLVFVVETKKIAIIGAAGYIGSALHASFKENAQFEVQGYDRSPPSSLTFAPWAEGIKKVVSYQIPIEELQQFDVVIYLGGLSGRVACDSNSLEVVQRENVEDIVLIAKRMKPSQLLIFATTSAITEGSGDTAASEDWEIQWGLLDRYSTSLAHRERELMKLSLDMNSPTPQMIGFRFGTVLGKSNSQKTEYLYLSLVCSALLTGRMTVSNENAFRAFLYLPDLVSAFHTVITAPKEYFHSLKNFEIFHLQSFTSNVIAAANSIAHQTSARIDFKPTPSPSVGFSLRATKFQSHFLFKFVGTRDVVINDLITHGESICFGRELTHRHGNESIPCVVCGSHDMMTVLDLGSQPLANDFADSVPKSMSLEHHPLKLMRCRNCHHAQLSVVIDRSRLFSDYSYQSGTSQTLGFHFSFIADKVARETGKPTGGTVIEIASNDGSQLDKFKDIQWHTYGVDPAANLAKIAEQKGHRVFVGFWGKDQFPGLPTPTQTDAIIAQNVLAHTETPVAFLRDCKNAMGPNTRLYLQTSQCEMFESGQFDTVYHEHMSFFSAHSFKTAAELAGLSIVNFEIVPIHGKSCLVTMMQSSTVSAHLPIHLIRERRLQMISDFFYLKFRHTAFSVRKWIHAQLCQLKSQGYRIGAYGAAAKGIVLLHFLRNVNANDRLCDFDYDFVVDDAPLKQHRYCPGTSIPILPTSELATFSKSPLVIVIFAWNFEEEIISKIKSVIQPEDHVLALIPFPTQRIVTLKNSSKFVLQRPHLLTVEKPLPRLPHNVLCITHAYNEELLLPFWIRHHSSICDRVIFIDYNSTDKTQQIFRRESPKDWVMVSSGTTTFEAVVCDMLVTKYELQNPGYWRIALTISEFLIHPNLHLMLSSFPEKTALRFPSFEIVGNDKASPLSFSQHLPTQRSLYSVSPWLNQYSRFIHNFNDDVGYAAGRHDVRVPWKWAPSGVIFKYKWSPWPESIPRKLQIGPRIPESDRSIGFGVQHYTATAQSLKQGHAAACQRVKGFSEVSVDRADDGVIEQCFEDWYATLLPPVTLEWGGKRVHTCDD